MRIDKMPAGDEIDILIAERVFGCKVRKRKGARNYPYCGCNDSHPHNRIWNEPLDDLLANYSEDINAAMLTVQELYGKGWDFNFDLKHGEGPCVGFYRTIDRYGSSAGAGASADTIPLAICRAILKIV